MRNILVTGANGFVGQALVRRLLCEQDIRVLAGSRHPDGRWPLPAAPVHLPDLATADALPSLAGVDAIIHCAARVHVMHDTARDPLDAFRRVNVEGSLRLARQAAREGVRRFIFLSSIKVNGERTLPGQPFTAGDTPAPEDAYGCSKHEAEQALRALSADIGLEVVILRPVLVYGPGVGANFLRMLRWLSAGVPLPLGAIDNRRSLIALDNLADLAARCIDHPGAGGQTFLAADGEDFSTPDLLRTLGRHLGRPARLLPVPATWLTLGARLAGQSALAERLCGSLQADITHTRQQLGWTPPVGADDALRETARHFLHTHRLDAR